MPVVSRVANKTHHWSEALAAVLLACLALCVFGARPAAAASPKEVSLRLVPVKATVKEREAIGLRIVFMGGTDETTLILPIGADASGIVTFRLIEIGSGREWAVADRDPRSFAADTRRRLPAGASIELHRTAHEFETPDNPIPGSLPAGSYRIVCTYDEGRTFSPENRTSRVLRSEPVEIVVTAP
jgi:hypothetical protein